MLFYIFFFFSSLAVGVGPYERVEYIHLKNYIPSRVERSMLFHGFARGHKGKLGSNFVKFSLFVKIIGVLKTWETSF